MKEYRIHINITFSKTIQAESEDKALEFIEIYENLDLAVWDMGDYELIELELIEP